MKRIPISRGTLFGPRSILDLSQSLTERDARAEKPAESPVICFGEIMVSGHLMDYPNLTSVQLIKDVECLSKNNSRERDLSGSANRLPCKEPEVVRISGAESDTFRPTD
jgi:hypothetical protein